MEGESVMAEGTLRLSIMSIAVVRMSGGVDGRSIVGGDDDVTIAAAVVAAVVRENVVFGGGGGDRFLSVNLKEILGDGGVDGK